VEAAFDFLSKEVEKIFQLKLYIWFNHIDKHNILWYIKITIDSLRVLGGTPGQDSPVSEWGISHCARCYVCTFQPFSARAMPCGCCLRFSGQQGNHVHRLSFPLMMWCCAEDVDFFFGWP
jgi:hypothetical protein